MQTARNMNRRSGWLARFGHSISRSRDCFSGSQSGYGTYSKSSDTLPNFQTKIIELRRLRISTSSERDLPYGLGRTISTLSPKFFQIYAKQLKGDFAARCYFRLHWRTRRRALDNSHGNSIDCDISKRVHQFFDHSFPHYKFLRLAGNRHWNLAYNPEVSRNFEMGNLSFAKLA